MYTIPYQFDAPRPLSVASLWMPRSQSFSLDTMNLRWLSVWLVCCYVCHVTFGQSIATMPVTDAKVSGSVQILGPTMRLATGSTVETGQQNADLILTQGGALKICLNSAVHLAAGANPGELMFSLDHGAMELKRSLGDFSDVVATPDLRILLSGPGTEDVKIRTNAQGDTCVDNAGTDSPYVTVTEQLGEGVYRVQPGQRVMLEHGSVSSVVDNEKEPCGCPAAPASATEFPLAQSEGLAPAAQPTGPAVPPGEVHAQATIPFVFDATHPPSVELARPAPVPPSAPPAVRSAPPSAPPQTSPPYLWDTLRHFFHRVFGKKTP